MTTEVIPMRDRLQVEARAAYLAHLARESYLLGEHDDSVRRSQRLADLLWVLDPSLSETDAAIKASRLASGEHEVKA